MQTHMELLQVVANTETRQGPKAITDFIEAATAKKQFDDLAAAGKWPHQEAGKRQPARPILELREHSGAVRQIFPEAKAKELEADKKAIEAARKQGLEKPAQPKK